MSTSANLDPECGGILSPDWMLAALPPDEEVDHPPVGDSNPLLVKSFGVTVKVVTAEVKPEYEAVIVEEPDVVSM